MSTRSHATIVVEPVFLRVQDARAVLGLSRSTIYELIRCGRLRSVREGASRLIPVDAIAEYKALLEREAEGSR